MNNPLIQQYQACVSEFQKRFDDRSLGKDVETSAGHRSMIKHFLLTSHITMWKQQKTRLQLMDTGGPLYPKEYVRGFHVAVDSLIQEVDEAIEWGEKKL